MANKFKRHINGLARALFAMVIFLIIVHTTTEIVESIQMKYLKSLPFEHFVTYHSIKPTKEEFKIDEHLSFVSDYEITKPVPIEWIDIVRCDFNDDGKYRFHREYISRYNPLKPHARSEQCWDYPRSVSHAGECFLDSTAKIEVADGIYLDNQTSSDPFKVVR